MGLLSKMFYKKEADDKSVCTSSSRTSSSRTSEGSIRSSKSKRKSSRKSKKDRILELTSDDDAHRHTPNEQIIANYLEVLNGHGSVEEMLAFFASPDVGVYPDGGDPATAAMFANILRDCYLSFEDMCFDGHSVKEVKPGVVLLEDNVVAGTHTGAPYQPLPSLAAVPASGKRVTLDPERVFFQIKDGKITKMDVISQGVHTGVEGLYVLAGGSF
ncbi:expressed unknown protein [Seminavis robusta]|uniref:SnoaL-like domain-containing protein n=1 Tax=Seminavis robusta TaxID=568900 RepID=A0A9N8ET08_9STRA|nr:expressed unknown protein [Seminavis robusta]|eukprot:Sro1738_g294500.1 n/a (215) ;mRNA; f:7898-8542